MSSDAIHPYLAVPDGWNVHRLKDLTTKIGSGATPRGGKNAYIDEGVHLIRCQNVLDLSFQEEGLAHITDDAADRLAGVAVQAGDVLLNITGASIARCCQTPAWVLPARVNQHVAIVRPSGEVLDSAFLMYLLVHPIMRAYVLSHNAGGSREAITKRHIEELQIPLPPMQEQRAISEVLGALDDRIEHLSAGAGLYDVMMQTAYQHLEAEQAERVLLGDIVEINPSTPLRRGTEAPYFDMGSLPERGFLPGPPLRRPYGSGTRFVAGDVLLARITPCLENGKTGIVPPVDGEVAWGSTEFIVTRASREVRGLVYGLFRDPDFRDYAVQHMSGSSGRQRVKADDIALYQVPDLASPAATRLGALAADWIDAGMSIRDQIQTVARLRDALLPRLLSGELRIDDPARLLEPVA